MVMAVNLIAKMIRIEEKTYIQFFTEDGTVVAVAEVRS